MCLSFDNYLTCILKIGEGVIMENMKKGILFTLMGVTNIGKTTQQKLLEERLKNEGFKVVNVKYPKYDLEPTGPRINAFLRGGNPENLSSLEFQELNVKNRSEFEPTLKKLIEENDIVIAEMYTGTGIAYGVGYGLDKDYLISLNEPLLKADLSILLDGDRFLESVEKEHKYEVNNTQTDKVKAVHLELANDFGWHVVNANQKIEDVHEEIYQKAVSFLNNR
jgi:thymidylate kinase